MTKADQNEARRFKSGARYANYLCRGAAWRRGIVSARSAYGRACVKTLGSGQRSDKMRVPIPHGPLSHEAIRRG